MTSVQKAYQDLWARLRQKEPAAIVTFVGRDRKECVACDSLSGSGYDDGLRSAIAEALACGTPTVVRDGDDWVVVEPHGPEPSMYVLGGGHVGCAVAKIAAETGFLVTVIDDRQEVATKSRFPFAERVMCDEFSGCLGRLEAPPQSYVVIATRGHAHDLDCLRSTFGRDFAYVGMMGSERRVAGIMSLLRAQGVDPGALSRIHAPIGVRIGALTPPEIAIAIMAQVIEVRRRGTRRCIEFDREVLVRLAEDHRPGDRGMAVVTVVAATGSTPRRAGAKMLVWADGTTMSSIGGGPVEAQAIEHAVEMICDGGAKYRFQEARFTEEGGGDAACGGEMRILIERLCG